MSANLRPLPPDLDYIPFAVLPQTLHALHRSMELIDHAMRLGLSGLPELDLVELPEGIHALGSLTATTRIGRWLEATKRTAPTAQGWWKLTDLGQREVADLRLAGNLPPLPTDAPSPPLPPPPPPKQPGVWRQQLLFAEESL